MKNARITPRAITTAVMDTPIAMTLVLDKVTAAGVFSSPSPEMNNKYFRGKWNSLAGDKKICSEFYQQTVEHIYCRANQELQ